MVTRSRTSVLAFGCMVTAISAHCATYRSEVTLLAGARSDTKATSKVRVLSQDPTDPYIEVAVVRVEQRGLGTEEDLIAEAKSEAGRLGADAIVISNIEEGVALANTLGGGPLNRCDGWQASPLHSTSTPGLSAASSASSGHGIQPVATDSGSAASSMLCSTQQSQPYRILITKAIRFETPRSQLPARKPTAPSTTAPSAPKALDPYVANYRCDTGKPLLGTLVKVFPETARDGSVTVETSGAERLQVETRCVSLD